MTFFDNFASSRLIAAHRGFRANYPENTLVAFEASRGRCHFIELDVQLSKDFIPMVIHDSSLGRTTDAAAKRQEVGVYSMEVKDWTAEQLKTLDAGSWFLDLDPFNTLTSDADTDNFSTVLQTQRPPTLEEVLKAPTLSQMPINVEIKDHSGSELDNRVTREVLKVIGETGSQHRVLISSFNHDYLLKIKDLAPQISTAALQSGHHPANLITYLKSIGVSAYHPGDSIASAEVIESLRTEAIAVNVYTVNDRDRQQELFRHGARAIFTDFPELAGH